SAAVYGGFKYAAGNTIRWGTNVVRTNENGMATAVVNDTVTYVADFYTDKADYLTSIRSSNPLQEAIAALGDSGGGVFDSSNRLVGIMDEVGTFEHQPMNTALFGNFTYIADVATYRTQINTFAAISVPE